MPRNVDSLALKQPSHLSQHIGNLHLAVLSQHEVQEFEVEVGCVQSGKSLRKKPFTIIA